MISSESSTISGLRRSTTPSSPIANRTAATARYQVGRGRALGVFLGGGLDPEHDAADGGDEQHDRRDLEGEQVVGQEEAADLRGAPERALDLRAAREVAVRLRRRGLLIEVIVAPRRRRAAACPTRRDLALVREPGGDRPALPDRSPARLRDHVDRAARRGGRRGRARHEGLGGGRRLSARARPTWYLAVAAVLFGIGTTGVSSAAAR